MLTKAKPAPRERTPGTARPLPMILRTRPDPDEVRNNAMRSLSRAAIATGLVASDPTAGNYAAKRWPDIMEQI